MRDAGRSAVAERARAQGRSVTYDEAGNPVIGDMPQTPIVQAGPEGTRIAYRNGMPVGFSTPTATPSAEEMRFNQPYRSDAAAREAQIQKETAALPAEQRASIAARLGVENTPEAIARSLSAGVSATRSSMAGSPEQGEEIRRQATALAAQQRATEIMRSGAQKFNADNATRGAQMTPMGAAPVAATTAAVPAPRQTPAANELRLEEDLEALAEAERLATAATQSVTPQEALTQAQQFLKEEPARVAGEQAQTRVQTYKQQVAEITRELTRALVRRDLNAVRLLNARLAGLVQNPPGRTAAEQAERRLEETQMASFPIVG
jgi:hypothetical protein